MSKCMPFIIVKKGKIQLNEEVLKLIENSTNPNLILFYGVTRRGKSTTLNQLIRGNHETWKFKNQRPFYSLDSIESVTKGCDIFGPIRASILIQRHLLDMKIEEDFDVFFCDTEGFNSLDGISKESIPGILTLLQLCTISVSISPRLCINDDLKELCSQIQISRFIKQMNNSLPSPLIIVYISNILYGQGEGYSDDNEEEQNYEKIKNLYEESRKYQKNKILHDINENRKLNIEPNDLEIIPGGKYQNIKNEKEPDHNDPFVKLYWDSIKDILIKFISVKKNNESKQMVDWIKFLFDIFKNVNFINDDLNLCNFIKNYISKSFEEFSKKQFELIKVTIKEDIKNNTIEYIKILNDNEIAKKNLNDCFDKNMMEIYEKLIPEKVNNFIILFIEQYRLLIKEEIDNEFESISNNILSDNNINVIMKDIVIMIDNAEFEDEIDFDKINAEKLWNDLYEEQKLILDYFKKTQINVLNNLKGSFISKISQKINKLINSKKKWENYLKEKMVIIHERINEILLEYFKKCNYQEDLEIYHIKYNDYYNNIYNKTYAQIIKEYFNNVNETKLIQVNENMNKIFKEAYDKIISNNRLPIWKNVKSDILKRIKGLFDLFISKIISNKEFRNDINLNLCCKKAFLNIIPLDFMQQNQVVNDKQNEIRELIDNEIDNYIKILNYRINSLPLYEKFIEELLDKCRTKIDEKIEELIEKIDYSEDKILFDSNIMFSFLTKNLNVYENANSKIEEINIELKKICYKKADEYIIKILQSKPEWKIIKNEKISKINNVCQDIKNKMFKKAFYEEDIKPIKKDDLLKKINTLKNLYKDVKQNKKKELNLEIDNIIEKVIEEINRKKATLPNWSINKKILLQDSIIEMENALKLDFKETKQKYKSIISGINDKEIIFDIIMWKVKEKKILDQCLDKKRKDELLNAIKGKAKEISIEYYNNEKQKEENKNKRKQEIKDEKEKLILIQKETKRVREERENLEAIIKITKEEDQSLLRQEAETLRKIKEELENLRREVEKSNWRKFINKNVQIRSILGFKNLDIFGGERRNGGPLILFDAHGQSNQKFRMILNGDNSVTFINDRFAIDVSGGIVTNFNQIQIYERNGTNAQKFYIMHEGDGWFSMHSALNQNYCIDINGGCPNNCTKVQLYLSNGSNAQKFKFIE